MTASCEVKPIDPPKQVYADGFSPLSLPPLLRTEAPAGYETLLQDLVEELQPSGTIAETFVADAAHHLWEIFRLRRAQATLINSAFREALENLLSGVCRDRSLKYYDQYKWVAGQYFLSAEKKQDVDEILAKFGLDQSAVVAESMRVVAEDIERLQRMEIEAEKRRDRALRNSAKHNTVLAEKLRAAGDRALNSATLPADSRPKHVA